MDLLSYTNYQYYKRDQNFDFSSSYIKLISEHYTFNKVTKFYLRLVLSNKNIFNIFLHFIL